jgi:CPA2 family monovalent cation:H+ antiporter-2
MVGTMTIITSFLSPYLIKFGWKIGDRFKEEPSEQREEEEQEEKPSKEDER